MFFCIRNSYYNEKESRAAVLSLLRDLTIDLLIG